MQIWQLVISQVLYNFILLKYQAIRSIYIEIADGCYTKVENIAAELNSCGRNVPNMSLVTS